MQKWLAALLLLVAALLPGAAHADVVVTFYSYDAGERFPHALLGFKGELDGTGEAVDTNYGFTAKTIMPQILFGPVEGMIETAKPKYMAKSTPHFAIHLTDEQYQSLMDLVEKWRNMPGKSYDLDTHNCTHFTMEAAALLGLKVNRKSTHFREPKQFMIELMQLNPGLKL